MGFLIGVDAGGTSTRIAVVDTSIGGIPKIQKFEESIKVLNEDYSASASHLRELLQRVDPNILGDVAAIVVGLSGASSRIIQQEICKHIAIVCNVLEKRVKVIGDVSLAMHSGFSISESGILLISGTGSAAVVRNRDTAERIIGGWGPLLGDEGSGRWIGLKALKHLSMVLDGRREADMLSKEIQSQLEPDILRSSRELPHIIAAKPSLIAAITRIVLTLAPRNVRAMEIVESAADALADLVLASGSEASDQSMSKLCLHGSIATHPILVEKLANRISGLCPWEVRVISEEDVLMTALEMARLLQQNSSEP